MTPTSKFIAVAVIVVALLASLAFGIQKQQAKDKAAVTAVDYPICAETADGVELSLDKKPKAELQLYPNCRSGLVNLPDNANFRVSRDGGKPGLEVCFWDGQCPYVAKDDKKWVGGIGKGNFRLRGEGVATITIERKT